MTIDVILEMSWDQITLAAKCVMVHKVDMLNMVLEPVAASLGKKYKKTKLNRNVSNRLNKNKNRTFTSKETRAQKDAIRLNTLKNLGFPIN